LNRVEGKENNTWLLPLVQNLASNMATEFFVNAEISPAQIKANLQRASTYLPEFERSFNGNSYAGVLFNSEVSTYEQELKNNKAKKPNKIALRTRAVNKLGRLRSKQNTQNQTNDNQNNKGKTTTKTTLKVSEDNKKTSGENKGQSSENKKGVKRVADANSIKIVIFGQEKQFEIYNFDKYCENFVTNILEPCSKEEHLVKAREMYQKYQSITDATMSTKDKLVKAMGEDVLNNFYNNYVDYAKSEAEIRSQYCEQFVGVVSDKLDDVLVRKTNQIVANPNAERAVKLEELKQKVSEDESLSNIKELEPLIAVVIDATREKANNKESIDDLELLNRFCKDKFNKNLDEYLEEMVEKSIMNLKQEKNANSKLFDKLVPSNQAQQERERRLGGNNKSSEQTEQAKEEKNQSESSVNENPKKEEGAKTDGATAETGKTEEQKSETPKETTANDDNVANEDESIISGLYFSLYDKRLLALAQKLKKQEDFMYKDTGKEEYKIRAEQYAEIISQIISGQFASDVKFDKIMEDKRMVSTFANNPNFSQESVDLFINDNFDNSEIVYKDYFEEIVHAKMVEKGLIEEPEYVEPVDKVPEYVENDILEVCF
ncbi:MAG: hypothetical protein ACI4TX_03595, partial [Christensenellales bacterium]